MLHLLTKYHDSVKLGFLFCQGYHSIRVSYHSRLSIYLNGFRFENSSHLWPTILFNISPLQYTSKSFVKPYVEITEPLLMGHTPYTLDCTHLCFNLYTSR